MFEIRNAGLEEIPLIQQLNLQVWPQTYGNILTPEQIGYMIEMMYSTDSLTLQMTKEGCQFIIIYENGNPSGFASYAETDPMQWKLHKIYVLPNQQGKGIGKLLIDHIIEQIKKKGGISLKLQVNRYNKAKEFYEKLGFYVAEIADFDIGNGFFMNDYVMEKKL